MFEFSAFGLGLRLGPIFFSSTWTPIVGKILAKTPKYSPKGNYSTYFWGVGMEYCGPNGTKKFASWMAEPPSVLKVIYGLLMDSGDSKGNMA